MHLLKVFKYNVFCINQFSLNILNFFLVIFYLAGGLLYIAQLNLQIRNSRFGEYLKNITNICKIFQFV